VEGDNPDTIPPGFSSEEWAQAVASGRAIAVDRPATRRPSRALRPVAAGWWFLGLALRVLPRRLATRAGHAGGCADMSVCEAGDTQENVDSVDGCA
jgi:hypothetical protein